MSNPNTRGREPSENWRQKTFDLFRFSIVLLETITLSLSLSAAILAKMNITQFTSFSPLFLFSLLPGAVTSTSTFTRRSPTRSRWTWSTRRLADATAARSRRGDAFPSTGRPFWGSLPTKTLRKTSFSKAAISSSKTVSHVRILSHTRRLLS